jgi:hypothetical protein
MNIALYWEPVAIAGKSLNEFPNIEISEFTFEDFSTAKAVTRFGIVLGNPPSTGSVWVEQFNNSR